MIWFTADLHFNHERIIELCHRPFDSVDTMNNKLIDNWNSKVKAKDTVYVLGDIFKKGDDINTYDIMTKLNGKKILIKGNHDKGIDESLFEKVYDYYELYIEGYPLFVLMHYPLKSWKGMNNGSIHLHGHMHNNPEYNHNNDNIYDVGVDACNYSPVSIEEIINYKNNK